MSPSGPALGTRLLQAPRALAHGGRLRAYPRFLLKRFLAPIAGPISGVATTEPVAALTFDDGPHPDWTPRVLDVLARHGARGTFFMVGRAAAGQRRLVELVASRGHAVANHSWDHVPLPGLSWRDRRRQITRGHRALAPVGLALLRPPYGKADLATVIDARTLGHDLVAWDVDPGDWWRDDVPAMVDHLNERVGPGSIVLLHDTEQELQPDRGAMIRALDAFLTQAGRRFRFVTVPELLRRGRCRRQSWQ